ncbi:MAG: thioesterase [Bacteroidales bacterium]|jgi:medium-chain acyl-[acyl-carrier-protein] hydrolase|nr:thioesterase [Bacteroidales bacterium]
MKQAKLIKAEAFSQKEEVRSFEVNSEKNMNIAGIARKFQEMAWEHSSRLKYGYKDLKKRNLHWVLTRTEIKIQRIPVWTELITLSTWPSGLDRLFFVRDFEYRNKQGDLCVSGSSDWMIVNDKLRPQIPAHVIEQIPINDESALGKYPEKLQFKDKMQSVFSVTIRLSDLDPNYHTNNIRYYQWTCDCLSEMGISDNDIVRVEMNFLYECRKGDVLEMFYAKDDAAHWVKGKRNGEQDVFLCRIEAEKR